MEYEIEDLVRVAKRDNNNKRPYLYVNPLQGKHISVSPIKFKEMCAELANRIYGKCAEKHILLIGFAETATAIAAEIATLMNEVLFFQCTTRETVDGAVWAEFTESHSHATEQRLDIRGYEEILEKVDAVVFVEDEVTTGNTICQLTDILSKMDKGSHVKFVIASVLNSMSREREDELYQKGYECVYVKKIPYEYRAESVNKVIENSAVEAKTDLMLYLNDYLTVNVKGGVNPRRITLRDRYVQELDFFVSACYRKVNPFLKESVLIIGTEELMHPALSLAYKIHSHNEDIKVVSHSTTRSPIVSATGSSYPLYNRVQLKSVYDEERETYIYNLEKYGSVIIVTDGDDENGIQSIVDALHRYGNENIVVCKIEGVSL